MDNSGKISKILEAVESAKDLLNEFLSPEITKHMTPEQLEQLEDARRKVEIDIPKASKELEKINEKYRKNAFTNS